MSQDLQQNPEVTCVFKMDLDEEEEVVGEEAEEEVEQEVGEEKAEERRRSNNPVVSHCKLHEAFGKHKCSTYSHILSTRTRKLPMYTRCSGAAKCKYKFKGCTYEKGMNKYHRWSNCHWYK